MFRFCLNPAFLNTSNISPQIISIDRQKIIHGTFLENNQHNAAKACSMTLTGRKHTCFFRSYEESCRLESPSWADVRSKFLLPFIFPVMHHFQYIPISTSWQTTVRFLTLQHHGTCPGTKDIWKSSFFITKLAAGRSGWHLGDFYFMVMGNSPEMRAQNDKPQITDQRHSARPAGWTSVGWRNLDFRASHMG